MNKFVRFAFIGFLILLCIESYATQPLKPLNQVSSKKSGLSPVIPPQSASDRLYPMWGFQFEISPGMTRIINNEIVNGDAWTSKGGFGYSVDALYFRSLSSRFRIKAGVGIDAYQENLTIDNYETTFSNQTDIDNDAYDEYFYLNNMDESTDLMYFSIPLTLEYGSANVDVLGFYIDLGVRFSFLINDSYSFASNTVYTTEGYYNQYNILLYGIPELGFYENREVEKTNSAVKSMNMSFHGAAGITYPLSNKIILKAGINTNLGLIDISDPKESVLDPSDPKYNYISSDNSLTANPEAKTVTRFIGFEVGIYLNKLLK